MNKFKGLLVLFLLIFSTFSFNLKEASADMLWQKVIPAEISSSGIIYPSLVIDGNNKLYLAFSDGANSNKATVMTYNGTNWETVGSAGFSTNTAYLTSLAIDGNNKLYVVFQDGANSNKATVMTYNGTNWETVGSAGFSNGSVNHISLAIDGNNKLYVSFSDGGNSYKATTMTYNDLSGEWETVGSAGFSNGTAYSVSLAIDGNNKLYVSFSDGGNSYKATTMTYNDLSGEWETVGSAGFSNGSANYTSLVIDGNNKLYVAFQDGANIDSATVMTYNGTNWETVGSAGFSTNTAYLTSLAIDGNNKLYVSFSDNTDGDKITVMTYNGTNWETVGSAGFSNGIYTSLATDGDNKLYIAFGDEGNGYKATVMVYDSYTPPETPTFAGGSGTEGDPYQISTCQQLQDINFTPDLVGTHPFLSGDDYFILTNNIDCSETRKWNDGAGFEPIGNNDEFPNPDNISDSIHLDGNNKTISNLYINRPNKITVGLFSVLTDSEIKDLNIEGDFTGLTTGMISGYVINTNIINCHTSGSINSISSHNIVTSAGGVLGFMMGDSSVSKSSSSATIESNFSGGLVGSLNGGTISDSYYNGIIIDGLLSGGLIGFHFPEGSGSIPLANVNIINSYSTGNINGAIVGGLAGILFDVSLLGVQISISDSYSTSEITNTPNPSVFDSMYGSVLGFDENSKYTGGLVGGFVGLQPMGVNSENIINTFIHNSGWYKTESNIMSDIGAYGYFGGGLTIEGQNKDVSNIFTESDNTLFYSKSHGVYAQGEESGWDFTTPIWYEQLNDYPKFTAYIPDTSSPVVSNTTITSITKSSATLNGEVTDNGGEEITEVGFEYGLTSSYATSTVESTDYASSTFSYDLTDLSCNTTYSYRAYATNTKGTSYSSSGTFTTDDCERSHSRVIGSVSRVIAILPVKEEVKSIISTATVLNIKRILKQNIIGNDIKELQVWLNNHGYIISLIGPGSKGYETTKFGSLTKKAVMSFQKANGLTPDGVVGPLTLKKMNEIK